MSLLCRENLPSLVSQCEVFVPKVEDGYEELLSSLFCKRISNEQIKEYMVGLLGQDHYSEETFMQWLHLICPDRRMAIHHRLKTSLKTTEFKSDKERENWLISWLRSEFSTIITVEDFFLFIAQTIASVHSGNQLPIHPGILTGEDPVLSIPKTLLTEHGQFSKKLLKHIDEETVEMKESDYMKHLLRNKDPEKASNTTAEFLLDSIKAFSGEKTSR